MSEYFPSSFAIEIARSVSLYPSKDLEEYLYDLDSEDRIDRSKAKRMFKKDERLGTFQEFATTASFEESLVAYRNISISNEQKEALKVIWSSTPNWIKGKIVGKVAEKLSGSQNGKEIKDLSETMMMVMEGGEAMEKDMKKIIPYIVNSK